MGYPISAGDAGMQAVLTAFEGANQTTKAVRNGVSSGMSAMRWTGDSATTYQGSMGRWLDGLTNVEQAMAQMDQAMKDHIRRTNEAQQHAQGRATF